MPELNEKDVALLHYLERCRKNYKLAVASSAVLVVISIVGILVELVLFKRDTGVLMGLFVGTMSATFLTNALRLGRIAVLVKKLGVNCPAVASSGSV